MEVVINIASRKYSFPTEKQRTMMKSEWFVFSLWAISNKTRSIVLLLHNRHLIHQKLKTTSKRSDEIGWCDKTEGAVDTRMFETFQVSFGQKMLRITSKSLTVVLWQVRDWAALISSLLFGKKWNILQKLIIMCRCVFKGRRTGRHFGAFCRLFIPGPFRCIDR